jgi:tRNA pseudouridine32 synthase / 23S rRNA pseudouridine746 synthase
MVQRIDCLSFKLVFADDVVLVLDKPSGLLSVPGKGADKQDCLSARVQAEFPDALVVHRLDMATSGLIVIARGQTAQRTLSNAFANRQVQKRYCAVVDGLAMQPQQPWAMIDLPIALDWPQRPLRHIDAVNGKPSQTEWQVDSVTPPSHGVKFDGSRPYTRVVLKPITGRSHQLRVHLAAIGHPILGDTLYAPIEVQTQSPRLLLHASHLTLAHPVTGQSMQFDSLSPF